MSEGSVRVPDTCWAAENTGHSGALVGSARWWTEWTAVPKVKVPRTSTSAGTASLRHRHMPRTMATTISTKSTNGGASGITGGDGCCSWGVGYACCQGWSNKAGAGWSICAKARRGLPSRRARATEKVAHACMRTLRRILCAPPRNPNRQLIPQVRSMRLHGTSRYGWAPLRIGHHHPVPTVLSNIAQAKGAQAGQCNSLQRRQS
jgi:hypothetical protein